MTVLDNRDREIARFRECAAEADAQRDLAGFAQEACERAERRAQNLE